MNLWANKSSLTFFCSLGSLLASDFALAQTTHTVILPHAQAAQLIANAGTVEQTSGGILVLGGTPSATGGTPPYIYAWTPTSLLNDPTLPNPEINITETLVQVFLLEVHDARRCVARSEVAVDITVTAISENSSEFLIRPNPASNVLNIDANVKPSRVQVMTLSGAEVVDAVVSPNLQQIDVRGLREGIYLIRIVKEADNKPYDFRVVIVR